MKRILDILAYFHLFAVSYYFEGSCVMAKHQKGIEKIVLNVLKGTGIEHEGKESSETLSTQKPDDFQKLSVLAKIRSILKEKYMQSMFQAASGVT